MSDETTMNNEKPASVENTGSVEGQTAAPDKGQAQGGDKGTTIDWEKQAKELEKKLGEQGNEMGKYKNYLIGIDPILKKLEGQDELIRAIVDGKINEDLAKAVLEGKVSVQDAKTIEKAHDEVKKDLGKKEYDKASAEEIEKRVEEKFSKFQNELRKEFDEEKENREFKDSVDEFIKNTPDFAEYVTEIEAWFDKHPGYLEKGDIEVAYAAVKGEKMSKSVKEEEDKKAAQAAKDLVSKGGGSMSKDAPQFRDLLGKLISPMANPNDF